MAIDETLRQIRRTPEGERQLLGVASGVARTFSVDPMLVRVAFGLLTLASGVGVLLYLALALVLPTAGPGDLSAQRVDQRATEQAVGLGCVTVGGLLLLRRVGVFFPDHIVWPAALVAAGVAIAWTRGARPTDLLEGGRTLIARVVFGALLVAGGVAFFVATTAGLQQAAQAAVAVVIAAVGAVVLGGPWIIRLARQLADERAERARSDERAEVAAHLHDSVLQTLALIQRRASSPAETIALARRQERELRAWLYGSRDHQPRSIAAALDAIVNEAESDFPVTVESVVVGDSGLTADLFALVAAIREAVRNAAAHSGASMVDVYVEVVEGRVDAFVRDRGRGFDPDAIDPDRHGVRDSIIERVTRHGGRATIHSAPSDGTEVALSMPLTSATEPVQGTP